MFNILTHNGVVTITNPATGQHRTFRVRTQPEGSNWLPGKRVLGILTGPDNTTDYSGFAFVDEYGIHVWKKCRGTVHDVYADMLANPEKWGAKGVEYLFEGRCRVCNRTLSTPESIKDGIGPTCAEKGMAVAC